MLKVTNSARAFAGGGLWFLGGFLVTLFFASLRFPDWFGYINLFFWLVPSLLAFLYALVCFVFGEDDRPYEEDNE